MPTNPYDQACRYLLRLFAVPLLAWLLRLSPDRIDFAGWLDTRGLPWPGEPDRTCDTVAHLREADGTPWAMPVEFQIEPDPDMFGRGLKYLGGLWQECRPGTDRGDRFAVGLVAVNLRGRGRGSRRMRLKGTKLFTGLGIVERNLSRIDAAKALRRIAAGRRPEVLLVLVPLFQGADRPGIISEWRRLADAVTDATLRRALPLALVFAEAAGRAELWRPALEGYDVIESQIVKEWTELARKKGIEEGIKEGRSEGLREGKIDTLLRVLRRLPGGVPADLEKAVRSLSALDRLDAALDVALSSASADDFRRAANL